MRHVFYISSSYAALCYAVCIGGGLTLTIIVALSMHPKELLSNECGPDHYEFWPSISSSVGDFMPERQIWRTAFVLCAPFRLGATISLFSVFWQKGCRGMADLYSLRHSPRQLMGSTAFLTLFMLWVDLWRLIGAVIWTMASSAESLAYHNVGFVPYVALCFLLQLTLSTLCKRNRYNLSIYPVQRDAMFSFRFKQVTFAVETVAALGVTFFYFRHKATCAPGSYSRSTMSEWVFALCNVLYDFSAWYELKTEGWWLSGSPSFYRDLFAISGRRERAEDAAKAGMLGASAEGSPAVAGAGVPMAMNAAIGVTPGTVAHRNTQDMDTTAPGTTAVLMAMQQRDGAVVGGERASAALNAPPLTTTGEFFLSNDVILHRFTFCSAPSRLTMWVCDIYWGYLFFEMMVHLVEHMYFQPLIAMALSWEMISLIVFAAPCLLRISSFRRWATGPCPFAKTLLKPAHMPIGLSYRVVPMYILFYFFSALSNLQILVQNSPNNKILAMAFGPLFLSLAMFTRFLYPSTVTLKSGSSESNEDSRRMLYAYPLGLLLSMLLRILYISQDPVFVIPIYASVIGVGLGIGFTTCIYRHAMFGNTIKDTAAKAEEDGVSYGTAANTAAAGGGASGVAAVGGGAGGTTSGNGAVGTGGSPGTPTPTVQGGDGEHGLAASQLASSINGVNGRRVQFAASQQDEIVTNTVSALGLATPASSGVLTGTLMGLITGLSLTFFTCANYIPRLVAVDPFPASLFVALAFALGLYYAPDVFPVAPQMMQPKYRLGWVSRTLQGLFHGSVNRFGALLMLGCSLMLFATRQTNFTYETKHDSYPVSFETPKEDVLIKYWAVEDTFSGNKYIAFVGGLIMTFCVAAMYPAVMEVCWCHQRARRFAQLSDNLDANAVYRREGSFLTSFELHWLCSTIVLCVVYALCISYPFVPMAWIFRERSRPLIFIHVFLAFFLTAILVRRARQHAKGVHVADGGSARKQRSMQMMVAILVVVAFLTAYIGRVSMEPDDISFPENRNTAVVFQDEVLHLHNMLIDLQVQRNIVTDPLLKEYETTFHLARFEAEMEDMRKNITDTKESAMVDARYKLNHLTQDQRRDVWDAARAMTFFSGMIWTVHFALDNSNVDSLSRMVDQAKKTEAGIVGILESDAMHVTNGNRDIAEYMSYYMGYRYTDYGPTALDNTYGCALISRYPILKVRRYVVPSPLGELSCVIYANLDVYGMTVHTYVGHFGNTEHWADGLLQSQFLGQLVQNNVGMSLFLGYLVTYPGNPDRYHQYADPTEPGKFRDTAWMLYVKRPWVRLWERGGYEEEPPSTVTAEPDENVDFNVEYKLPLAADLEREVRQKDTSFRRTPPGEAPRYFYFNQTNRYSTDHPRFEFVDRYCQYNLYKTGATVDEKPENANKLQIYQADLFDWRRIVSMGVEKLSDTEIQVTQLRFYKREN